MGAHLWGWQVEYLNTLYGVDVPLLLMNSFKTDEITIKMINKYRMHNLTIHTFMQVSRRPTPLVPPTRSPKAHLPSPHLPRSRASLAS
jgi:hypothetical protein